VPDSPPYGAYAAITAAFCGGLAGAGALGRALIREPLVEDEPEGGFQQALAELVTCTRCTGTWVAAGLGATQIVAPRFGRLITWTLGAAGVSDFLQAGFAALTRDQ